MMRGLFAGRMWRLWLGGFAALAAGWLGGEIVGNTGAATRGDPTEALLWRPQFAPALVALAESQAKVARADADFVHIEDLAKQALVAAPLNQRALRLLGIVADFRSDPSAAKLMQAAAERSPRDPTTQLWLLQNSLAAGGYAAAVAQIDLILRAQPDLGGIVMPAIAEVAQTKAGQGFLVAALDQNPPWRAAVLQGLPGMTDPSVFGAVLTGLEQSPHSLRPAEVRPYIDYLASTRQYARAYLTWVRFLPPEQ